MLSEFSGNFSNQTKYFTKYLVENQKYYIWCQKIIVQKLYQYGSKKSSFL